MIDEVENAIKVLKNGGVILYPTDTVWGIGCDATNVEAVKNIFKIKKRTSEKALICLVHDIKMLKTYVSKVPEEIKPLISDPTPTTIIYNNPENIAENLVARDNTLAIRIPKHEFSNRLIAKFGRPIVSTSANISGSQTPTIFSEITNSILEGVDHVVNLEKEKKGSIPSRIFKIDGDGKILTIRK
ncbi:MAG: L-threonylcarbamoyladenylate synthase [Flavobacteriaceae bacterium]|nr:L-threonylcarbamoyladenylate synthase [Flavobacteriaceae bacterium]